MNIIKRDGQKVPFDTNKIKDAIMAANSQVAERDRLTDEEAGFIVGKISDRCLKLGRDPGVEEIQDMVLDELGLSGHIKLMLCYSRYRDGRNRAREANESLMRSIDEIINVDARKSKRKRENANIDGNTPMGAMLQIGSACAKAYNDLYLLRPEHAKAHREGDIHIHDFDFYAMTTTCCQIDLLKLFHGGFSTGHGYLREPQSIRSYAALAAIAIQANQNDQHGGQSIPNFDYCMAEGIRKTYRKWFIKFLALELEETSLDPEETVKISETESGTVLSMEKNEAFDRALCMQLGGTELWESEIRKIRKRALRETENDTYQAMEGFIHNMNTMHSRAGAQTPFSSINYGTDVSPEGRMAIKNILLALDAGLGHGETSIFPIHIFKVKEGVNYNDGDPNRDLFQLSCKVSAKRLFPNYVFLDSPYNLKYYKPGHPETEVCTMGCLWVSCSEDQI